MRGAIINRRRIERPNLAPVAFDLFSLIETRLRLIAEQAAFDHLGDELRQDEDLTLGIVRQIFVQVLDHVSKNIQTDQVKGAKGRSLWSPDSRSRNFVDFFD